MTNSENGIRAATADDLRWLDNGFDQTKLAEQSAAEKEVALLAGPTPPHWKPVENHMDEAA